MSYPYQICFKETFSMSDMFLRCLTHFKYGLAAERTSLWAWMEWPSLHLKQSLENNYETFFHCKFTWLIVINFASVIHCIIALFVHWITALHLKHYPYFTHCEFTSFIKLYFSQSFELCFIYSLSCCIIIDWYFNFISFFHVTQT